MLRYFKSSPLWLIGLFIIFAQGTATVAAVKVEGRPQTALVIFVITYSAVVTVIFFIFLWLKPENLYGPSEYGEISPESFVKMLKGFPNETASAVVKFDKNPNDPSALFALMDNLIAEDAKQHLILMRKNKDLLDISNTNTIGFTHNYEFITRNKGLSVGLFSPSSFLQKLKGTDLVRLSGGQDKILLTEKGESFADWLIQHERDAEAFKSVKGSWGKIQTISDVMDKLLLTQKPQKNEKKKQ